MAWSSMIAARAAPTSRSSTARSITSAPISALSAAGLPWRTMRPWSMIATRSASSSGLLQVLGGQEDGGPEPLAELADAVPDQRPATAVEPGGGSSR